MITRASAPRGRRIALLLETDGPGGAEQVVVHLAERLVARGHRPLLCVPRNGEGWIRERLRGVPAEIVELPLHGPADPRGILRIALALRHHRCDLLHTHEFGQAIPGLCAARLAGIPHVLTIHGGRYWAERRRRRLALRLAIAWSDACTAVSAPLAADLTATLRLPASAITVLPNGARASTARANGTRADLGLTRAARLILAVGNLYPVKGHRFLVDALARLAPRHPELHVVIAGRGSEEARLIAQARAAGIADRVHLLGLRDDIGALLASADLFAHPSLAEGLPLAVLEAMFAARPVVASAVGEIPTVLADGACGRLVPPGDGEELASAIEGVLTDPEGAAQLGTRARQRALEEYTLDRMMDRYLDVYQTAMLRRGPR